MRTSTSLHAMGNSNRKMVQHVGVTAGLIVVVIVVALTFFLDRGYGKVSREAYQVATALYGACLSKSAPRIEKIQELLHDGGLEFDATSISPQEKRWLQDVVQQAQESQWASAAAAAKRMMVDQND